MDKGSYKNFIVHCTETISGSLVTMIFALVLLFFGATATFGRPNSIMVSYDGTTTLPPMVNFEETTTTPPMVNFMDNSPNPNIIHLRYDKDTQMEMLARDPSYWVQWKPYWNTGGNDDNSTLHIDPSVNDDGQDRIIDGQDAQNGQLPMQASLSISFDFGGVRCGSTIVRSQWLLTAAHCIQSKNGNAQSIMVRAGSVNINSGGQTAYVSLTIGHPNYKPEYDTTPSGFDIALLKLSKKLIFTSRVKWAYMLQHPNPSPGTQLTVAGWGLTENGSASAVLKFASVTVATCPKFGSPNIPINSLICTMPDNGNDCSGDSGGFVGYKHTDGRYVVEAVVSFGPTPVDGVCPSAISGHTRVGFYLNWLLNTIDSN